MPQGVPGGGPVTHEDRRAQIDRRFDETFAVFDERMRSEQEAVSRERAARAGSTSSTNDQEGQGGDDEEAAGGEGDGKGGSSGEGEGPGDGSGEGGEGGDGRVASTGTSGGEGEQAGGSGQQTGGGGGVGGGARGGSGPSTVPADIPDGKDDDIVARQLREAAMKETDPELRERLWEEYRQYKKSTS
jgi:hypothetical protein